jgi:xanthosine utilization system XapX-like protein
MKYIGVLALVGCLLCFPMSTWAASLGEGDASGETMAMGLLALSAGPLSVGMVVYNAHRILNDTPSVASGVLGIVVGDLSMLAGFSLLSEDSTYSRLLISAGVASVLLGGASIAIGSHEKSKVSDARVEFYPRISRVREGGVWSGIEFRWHF